MEYPKRIVKSIDEILEHLEQLTTRETISFKYLNNLSINVLITNYFIGASAYNIMDAFDKFRKIHHIKF